MLKVENIETVGFEAAIRGMRNPLNSWAKSDSYFTCYCDWEIGENDLGLMKRLYNAGTEHRKYLRMITVAMDITAPLYWWKEFDTYKVGTVCNSCSTMHKIHAKEFTLDDFSHEHLQSDNIKLLEEIIFNLNRHREWFISKMADDPKLDWWQMIQLLPSSYNQRRTVMMNYEVCVNLIKQRTGHKLDEWHTLIAELIKLPYIAEITGYTEE